MSVNGGGPVPETEGGTYTAKIVSTGNAAGTGEKSRSKPKEKKETKTKEFNHSFAPSETNYLELLRTILMKHGEEQYNITAKMTYNLKVQLPGVKKAEALDVDTFNEYKALADDIIEASPAKVTVYVDMAEIRKRWSPGHDTGSDEEDVNGDDPRLYDGNGLSELDRSLARLPWDSGDETKAAGKVPLAKTIPPF
ncbi:hypothetical protein B0H14DRAFT_2649865 [Mycena olivaceomarginata]|nr:hypothetical protein B0H14DRAFT_2649865 [Mycena olivaceomarginata]